MNTQIDNLQQIQALERNILAEFIRICHKYHLRYYLAEGSLLGAIRHQGMIPWDDDIDVAMFREDYERFMEIAPKELDAQFELRSYRHQADYIECIAKLEDRNHQVISDAKGTPFTTNLWIDIFVIDGMPKGKLAFKLRKLHLLATKLMLMWSNVEHYATARKRPYYETLMIAAAKRFHFSRFINTSAWLRRLDRAMASVPADKQHDTVIFTSEYRFRSVHPFDFYGTPREVPFDSMNVSIPHKSEEILQRVYGDYMKLPPEDARYKHKLQLIPNKDKHN